MSGDCHGYCAECDLRSEPFPEGELSERWLVEHFREHHPAELEKIRRRAVDGAFLSSGARRRVEESDGDE